VEPTPVANCSKYNAIIDKCSECNEYFFLNSKENKCINNPDGIPGCEKYKSKLTCGVCRDDMYLLGNKCVMSVTRVDGCAKYESEGICQMCKSTHLKVGNECIKKNNIFCEIWKDIDNCESCAPLKVLKMVDQKMTCVSISILNCEASVMNGNVENCLKCKQKMVPSEDKLSCISPPTEITDCLIYNPESPLDSPKCDRCIDKRVLSKSKYKCTAPPQITTGSCLHGVELEKNKCMHCGAGHHFDGEGCVSCGGEGCLSCDVTNPEKCFVCLPKYTMSISGSCKVTFVEDNTGMTPLWRMMYVLMIGLLFIFEGNRD
jgi:hypothetical protein